MKRIRTTLTWTDIQAHIQTHKHTYRHIKHESTADFTTQIQLTPPSEQINKVTNSQQQREQGKTMSMQEEAKRPHNWPRVLEIRDSPLLGAGGEKWIPLSSEIVGKTGVNDNRWSIHLGTSTRANKSTWFHKQHPDILTPNFTYTCQTTVAMKIKGGII